MILRSVFAAILVFIASVASADEASKAVKLRELMKAQGMFEIIEQEKRMAGEQARSAAVRIFKEFRTTFPAPTPAQEKAMDDALQKFLRTASAAWQQEDAVQSWTSLYGASISEADLDVILAFYRSSAGQKDVEASKKAMEPWARFFIDRTRSGIDHAAQAYRTELKTISGRKTP